MSIIILKRAIISQINCLAWTTINSFRIFHLFKQLVRSQSTKKIPMKDNLHILLMGNSHKSHNLFELINSQCGFWPLIYPCFNQYFLLKLRAFFKITVARNNWKGYALLFNTSYIKTNRQKRSNENFRKIKW